MNSATGMNGLLELYQTLAEEVDDNPTLFLAHTVAWLDPLWTYCDDDAFEEGDSVGMALSVTRSDFPDIYAGAIEGIRSGASYAQLDSFICGEISQRGIPLDNLEYMGYGIPLQAAGVELSDPELYECYPDFLPVVDLFGIRPEEGQYNVEVPEVAYEAGRITADSLVNHADEGWQQVGWALAWLFSCSGNTLVDFDDESLAEVPPLTWDQNDLAFAVELIAEAGKLIADALAGLKLLQRHSEMFQALTTNVQLTFKSLAKSKGKNDESRIRLEWPSIIAGTNGSTVVNPELLQLRLDAA